MEALERRVFLSITDLNASFGTGGRLANPLGLPYGYIASNGDGIFVYDSGSTQTNPGLPSYFAKVADVADNGTVRWTSDTNADGGDFVSFYLFDGAAGPGGSFAVGESGDYGNNISDLVNSFNSSGSLVGGANIGTGLGFSVDAIAPFADGSVAVAVSNFDGTQYSYSIAYYPLSGPQITYSDVDPADTAGDVTPIALDAESNGDLLVAGSVTIRNRARLIVEQFNSDGALDTTFGQGGAYVTPYAFSPSGIVVAPSGEIYLKAKTGIIAFTAAGQLDNAFGDHGQVVTAVVMSDLTDLQIASDGSLYAAGVEGNQPSLVQISATGTILQSLSGSSEFGDTSASWPMIAVTSTGELVSIQPNGNLEEGVGFSVAQPTGETTPPAARLDPLRRIPSAATRYDLNVRYAAAGGIDAQTISSGTIFLRYGRHKYVYGTLIATATGSDRQITATYSFPAPGGTWLNNPGTYTVETADDEVTDNAGNGVPLEVLGSFTIKAEKSANAAGVVQMDMPMLAAIGTAPSWLKSDGEVL